MSTTRVGSPSRSTALRICSPSRPGRLSSSSATSGSTADALGHLARTGGMMPTQLGELLGMTSGGVTALTQRLERAGHISREPHPKDKRSSILKATPEIVERVQAEYRVLIRDTDRITARLSEQEREVIGDYLERLVLLAERYADEALAALEATEDREPQEPVELWA